MATVLKIPKSPFVNIGVEVEVKPKDSRSEKVAKVVTVAEKAVQKVRVKVIEVWIEKTAAVVKVKNDTVVGAKAGEEA